MHGLLVNPEPNPVCRDKLIPAEQSGEYFGIYDICGKGASLAGTSLVALISQISGSVNTGVGALPVTFLLGVVFFLMTEKWPDP